MVLFAKIFAPFLYLAVAYLLVAWVGRGFPMRRRVALLLVLLPLLFTGRAMLTGLVYGPIDLAYQGQPFAAAGAELGVGESPPPILHDLYTMILPGHRAVRHAWSNGEWPLWNPFILCGQVLAGAGQAAPFYPPHLLSLLLPLPLALGFVATLHFFLAVLGAFLLSRDLGCREGVALVAGAGWMAMNGTVFWISWPLGMTMVLLPLVLLGVRHLVHDPGWSSCLLLTAPLALGLLAGHPETTVHHIWVGAAWGLWELARRPRRTWWPVLAWAGLGGLLTLGLTAIFVLPLLDGLAQTFEWSQRHNLPAWSAGSMREVVGRMVGSFVPFVHQNPPANGRFHFALPGAYVGSILFAPAAYGLWRSRRRERWPLAAFVVVGLLVGARMPGLYQALELLPLLDRTINDRLIALTGLALALLAGLGLEAWCEAARPRELGRAALATLAVLAAAVLWLWEPMRSQGLAPASLAIRVALLLAPPLLCLPVLLRTRWKGVALGAILVLLMVQRVAEVGGYHPVAPVARFYPPIESLEVPAREGGIFRIVGIGSALVPNQGVHYGLEDLRGYDAVHHLRFRRVARLWTTDPPLWFGRVRAIDSPLLSFLNVRWALVPNRFEPGAGWTRVRGGPAVGLWRNGKALERAFLPHRVRLNDRPRRILAEMEEAADFAEVAWVETSPEAARAGGSATATPAGRELVNGRGEVLLRRDGLGYRLDARLEAPAWVVISDVAWRGWRARGGGHELPLGVANFAFLALELPAGSHEVELFFRPRSFEIGLGITAATLAGLLLVGLRRRFRGGDPVSG